MPQVRCKLLLGSLSQHSAILPPLAIDPGDLHGLVAVAWCFIQTMTAVSARDAHHPGDALWNGRLWVYNVGSTGVHRVGDARLN